MENKGWSTKEKLMTLGLAILGTIGIINMLASGNYAELARIITLNR